MAESFAAGLIGIVLDGRYRLDALLGEGGMGAVYRAHHLAMDRRVAVKLLKPHLTTDEAALHRFAREARSTLKVDSPHAVKVLDFGVTPQSDYYMVLEYLDGRTVQRELDVDGPFAPARVLHIARQSLLGLGASHRSALVHRDVKPDNILLMRVGDDPDFTKVLDFGVAKLMEGAAQSSRSALAITQAGMVFGTPEFMSPEQACGQTLDGRSDLYSLAATMFAMLTGCGLYPAKTPLEWLTCHARTPPPHLGETLPELAGYPELDLLMQRCLAKHADQRPANADEMIRLIDEVMPTLGGRGAGTPVASAPTPERPSKSTFSHSSFIEALTLPEPDAAPRISPYAPTIFASTPTTGVQAAAPKRRRGAWLAIGAVAIMAMIVAVIVVASHTKSRAPVLATKAVDLGSATPGDAAITTAPPIDATVTIVAAPPPDAGDFAGRRRGGARVATHAREHRCRPVSGRRRASPARRQADDADKPGRCCASARSEERSGGAADRRRADLVWRSRPRLQVLTRTRT